MLINYNGTCIVITKKNYECISCHFECAYFILCCLFKIMSLPYDLVQRSLA